MKQVLFPFEVKGETIALDEMIADFNLLCSASKKFQDDSMANSSSRSRNLEDLKSKLAGAQARLVDQETQPIIVPISTLAPEPLEIIGPIHAVIQATEHEYLAVFLEANLGASGETRSEALDGLKDQIISTFERLSAKSDDRLGPGPLRQKRVLESLIRRF